MSDFSDFKTQIAEWANRQDWSDLLVTSYVRGAEEKFNAGAPHRPDDSVQRCADREPLCAVA